MVSSVSNKNSMLEQQGTTRNNKEQPSKFKKKGVGTTRNNLQNFKKRCKNNLQQPSKFKKI